MKVAIVTGTREEKFQQFDHLLRTDREAVTTTHPAIGFEPAAEVDYGVLHAAADHLLDTYWPQIGGVARTLAERQRLTGDEIAAPCGITNSRNPNTAEQSGQ